MAMGLAARLCARQLGARNLGCGRWKMRWISLWISLWITLGIFASTDCARPPDLPETWLPIRRAHGWIAVVSRETAPLQLSTQRAVAAIRYINRGSLADPVAGSVILGTLLPPCGVAARHRRNGDCACSRLAHRAAAPHSHGKNHKQRTTTSFLWITRWITMWILLWIRV